nr:(Fe-S)-binding protein [Bacteroidales bacterium]
AISVAMVEQKVENALATGAEYIVSTDSSCLMNMEGYIKKHHLPIKTIHIIDLLASGLPVV